MAMRARFFVPFLILFLFTAALASGVETTCITPAVGVPGQSNTPPHWWDASADPPSADPQPVYRTCLTDPRWVESTAVSYDSGTGEDMLFRVLYDNTFVYLSWWIKSPPFGNPDQNLLYFGFQDSGIGGATEPAGDRIVKISLNTGTTTEAGGGVAINTSTFLRYPGPDTAMLTTGQGLTGDAVPGWLSTTARVWIHDLVGGNCPQNPDFWAVQVRIPRANITTSGNAFKIWYEVLTSTLSTPVVKFTWPRQGADITEGGFPVQEIYPAPTVWNSFQFSSGPSDPMCPAAGVSIDWQNIGTTNVPDYRVLFAQVPPAASHPVNNFFARATNHTGSDIPAGSIRGTFRIANWGSMPNWEDGVPIDELWAPIQCGTDGSPTLTDCGTNVASSGLALADGTTATAGNDIHFSWALTNAQLAPFASNAKRADNCLLVELSSAMSPGLVFTKRSVKKNMIFGHTSDFVDSAEVSIKGLSPIAADGRDLYIWVEALNMPQKVARDAPIPKIPVKGGRGTTEGNLAGAQAQQTVSVNDDRLLARLNAEGRLAQADLDAAMPTYRVHVYHDTGATRKIGGVVRPVLNAQGAFGYYLAYTPPVVGWRHKLEAVGFTLEELEPNFYRIRKVPNKGVVPLKIYIRSLHEGDQDTPLGGPTGSGTGRFRVFLDAGPNFPHGDFGQFVDNRFSVNAGLEAFLAPNTSIEGIVGYHTFKVPFVSAPRIWQLSANVKQYFGPGPLHFFINGGAGAYRFDPGSTTKFGANAGAGLLYDVSATWGLEGVYNYHAISTSGSKIKFSTVQVGIRHRLF
jgi:hypothetical protein